MRHNSMLFASVVTRETRPPFADHGAMLSDVITSAVSECFGAVQVGNGERLILHLLSFSSTVALKYRHRLIVIRRRANVVTF